MQLPTSTMLNYLKLLEELKRLRKEIDIAFSLNPNSLAMNLNSARLYQYDGRYEKAIIEVNKAQEINNYIIATHIIKWSVIRIWE